MAVIIANPKTTDADRNINVPVEAVSSASGTVDKGFIAASFLNSGAADITVNGQKMEPGASKTYPPIQGRSYAELSLDASAGEVTILVIY